MSRLLIALIMVLAVVLGCGPSFNTVDVDSAMGKVAVGMTRGEVIEALGKPSFDTKGIGPAGDFNSSMMTYDDNKDKDRYLSIRFDDDVVVSVRIEIDEE